MDAARRVSANTGRLVRRLSSRGLLPAEGGVWLAIHLGPETQEQRSSAIGIGLAGGSRSRLGLLDALQAMAAAEKDPRVAGVVLRFHGGLPGWSKALALRRAVDALRAVGKRVVSWAEVMGAESYLVASGGDRVWLPESGSLQLTGLRSEQLFVRGLLSHLDVKPEVVRVGSHKGAGEFLTRDGMSPEQRKQIEAWLDDVFAALVEGIAKGRELDAAGVRERIDDGPYGARRAVEKGLVDACLYPDELEEALVPLCPVPLPDRPGPRRPKLVDAHDYFVLHASDTGWRPLRGDLPRIAYVVADGAIRRGSGLQGGVTSDGYRALFDRLADQPEVRGVVVRIDSPGGDGIASDLLHRSLSRLSREKPVVVSMGDVAASGGYYMAAAADAVFAEAGTLTGSIGVVGGKLNLEGLYRRLGIAQDSVERGSRAGMDSAARGFTPDERGAVKREMETLYETFLARVAEGRRLSLETVRRLAQGRVWSGAEARQRGLVDALGGPLEALREARRRAGVAEGERVLLDFHPRRPRLDLRSLLAFFGGASR